MTNYVWKRVSASSRKVKARPFSEYVTLVHGLLPLLQKEEAAKLRGALRECFDLSITHISFFDRIDIADALINAIQENNDQKKNDPEHRDYQAKMAEQFNAVAKDKNVYVIASSSGIDYRVRFQESGRIPWVHVCRMDQPKAFGSFMLNEFKDIIAEDALDERVPPRPT